MLSIKILCLRLPAKTSKISLTFQGKMNQIRGSQFWSQGNPRIRRRRMKSIPNRIIPCRNHILRRGYCQRWVIMIKVQKMRNLIIRHCDILTNISKKFMVTPPPPSSIVYNFIYNIYLVSLIKHYIMHFSKVDLNNF